MTDKEREHLDTELWGNAIEDAVQADVTRLLVLAQHWKEKGERCDCASCTRKVDASEEDKNEAIYHWYADGDE